MIMAGCRMTEYRELVTQDLLELTEESTMICLLETESLQHRTC